MGKEVDIELEGAHHARTPSLLARHRARWDKMGFFRKLRSLPDEELIESGKDSEPSLASLERFSGFSGRNSLRSYTPTSEERQDVCNINDSPRRLIKMAASGKAEELEKLLCQKLERGLVVDELGKSLLHHAAENGRVETIDMLVQRGCDIAIKDLEGNTPLHLASMHDQLKAVESLIALKAPKCAFNDLLETPMHIAIRFRSVSSLECIINACVAAAGTCCLVNKPGWHGKTPLHVACLMGSIDCVKLLIRHGANPLLGCKSGSTPIHVAATQSADAVLHYLLNEAGIDKELALRSHDEERRSALHWAVVRGSPSTVRLLIENGAPTDAQMNDGSTPLHLACTQGLMPVVMEMFRASKSGFCSIVTKRDSQGMTPLHRAAMFDHGALAAFLVEQGTPINDKDHDGRTPLIIAATQASWEVMTMLLKTGADPKITDNLGRNYLHYYISQGFAPECSEDAQLSIVQNPSLLSEMDLSGCTPLHYAAQNGFIKSSDSLMSLGASVNAKNKAHQSPLHFAAAHGRYNTVRRLLDSSKGFNIINETDNFGRTPLHLASKGGHTNVVQLLMSKGALTHRDYAGQTQLHYAAEQNYTETARLFVEHYSYLLNCSDRQGNTALHLAAKNNAAKTVEYLLIAGAALLLNSDNQCPIDLAIQQKHHEAATAMVMHKRWKEILTQPSPAYGWPVLGLIEHLPEVMATALDRCITHSGSHPMAEDFMVKYDFTLLEPEGASTNEILEKVGKANIEPEQSLKALNAMVKHGRSELIDHGVCCSYLNNKWASYGLYVHGFNVSLYATFLALLTYLVVEGVQDNLLPHLKAESYENIKAHTHYNANFTEENDFQAEQWLSESHKLTNRKDTGSHLAVVILVCIFTEFNMLKELVQLYHQRWFYFRDCTNYLEWFLYVSATIFAMGGCQIMGAPLSWQTRWQLGAFAIFIAWFSFMLYLQRFGLMGVYVVMYLGVLKTLLRAIFVFAFLIIAFSLAFHVLIPMMVYPNDSNYYLKPNLFIDVTTLRTPHQTFGHSLIRTISMMLGDFDMISNYIYPTMDHILPFPTATYIFVVVFVGTVSILLMNLLIGLAVGDIEKVQSGANLRRLAMQVELHTRLESKLPKWFLKRIVKTEDQYYPNRCSNFYSKKLWFITRDPYDNAEKLLFTDGLRQYSASHQQEFLRQRKKLKEAHAKLDKQYELLRLIVQKMDINEEADQLDEGLRAKGPQTLQLAMGQEHKDHKTWKSMDMKFKAVRAFQSVAH